MLSSCNLLAPSRIFFESFPQYCSKVISEYGELSRKIHQITQPYFASCSGIYHCGYGTVELSKNIYALNLSAELLDDIEVDSLAPSTTYLHLHGFLTVAAGVCSLFEGLSAFGVINFGEITGSICTAGSVFFLYANLIALEENIRVYEELLRKEVDNEMDEEKLTIQKHAVIWGILGNLGYITATAILLLGGSTAMALIIGIIASFSNGFKVLCDFILWKESSL